MNQHKIDIYIQSNDNLAFTEAWVKDAVADYFDKVYEREWNEGEVVIIARQNAKESPGTDNQHPQPAMCLGCEYWRMPSGGHCMRGEGIEFCFKVGTHAGVR
ncbi:MAG: hypothetical protein PHV93_04600 [Candidatus Pacebacteria bacterium]|nr:hypothetical protein [Candidatus Paceibacterota bacterium]